MALTRSELAALIAANLPDNSARFITPARHRAVSAAILEAAVLAEDAPWTDAIAAAIAAAAASYATAAQGAKADSAVQPPALDAAIAALAPVVEVVTAPPSAPVAGRFYVIVEA